MIHLHNVALKRGAQTLLEQAQLSLYPGMRTALVGRNGSGKSSLLALLLGQLEADAGDLDIAGGVRMSHMAQEVSSSDSSALDYVLDGDPRLRAAQQAIAEAESSGDSHRLAHAHQQLQDCDGYTAESRAAQLLMGLGFQADTLREPVASFSGGWRMRINLAKTLMSPADLLLLDEPTNHLDLDATLWLEGWLSQYTGALIVISHDRSFIDAVATHVIHLHQQRLTLYKGGFSQFEQQRAEALRLQQAQWAKQQKKVAEVQRFIDRFKAKATKARQAQSRVKMLEKLETIAAVQAESPFSFALETSEKTSSPLINLTEVDAGYTSPLLRQIQLSINPGDRIGLLGPNGAGKSTLIRLLADGSHWLAGERLTGEHLSIGYFAQHQVEALDMAASALTHLQRLHPQATEQQLRDVLGGFDFRGDKALEPLTGFSGGELARLALAMIASQKPNLLLLDEPTNHLDLDMREALTLALQGFNGAVVLVSHDRHLLSTSVDQFVLVADHQVTPFDGDLADYQTWLQQHTQQNPATSADQTAAGSEHSAQGRKERKRIAAEQRRKLSPLKRRIEKLETELESLQVEIETMEQQLGDTRLYQAENKPQLTELLNAQAAVRQRMQQTEEAWLGEQEALEALQQELAYDGD